MKLKPLTMEEMRELIESLKALDIIAVDWEFYWYGSEYQGRDNPTLTKKDCSHLYMWGITELSLQDNLKRLTKAFDGPGVYRFAVQEGRLYKVGDIWMPQPELEVQMLPEDKWSDVTPG